MIQKSNVQKDVSRFIEKWCISTMDKLITWNFQNEFGLELQIIHSFRWINVNFIANPNQHGTKWGETQQGCVITS